MVGLIALGPGTGTAAAAPDDSACQTVSASMVDVPGTDSEPALRIPVPQGWEIPPALEPADDSIRIALVNPDLASAGFTPNAVIALKKLSSSAGDPQAILAAQGDILVGRAGATDLTSTPTSVCGLPAATITYTAPATAEVAPRRATSLVVVDEEGDTTYVATVTIQSTKPDSGDYADDARTILDGFQVLPAP